MAYGPKTAKINNFGLMFHSEAGLIRRSIILNIWRFGSAAIRYVVRSTIGLLSDSNASCHKITIPGVNPIRETWQFFSSLSSFSRKHNLRMNIG